VRVLLSDALLPNPNLRTDRTRAATQPRRQKGAECLRTKRSSPAAEACSQLCRSPGPIPGLVTGIGDQVTDGRQSRETSRPRALLRLGRLAST
jgi:hypothetical protein